MDLSGWFEVVRLAAVTAAFVVAFYRLTEWIGARACERRSPRPSHATIGKVDLQALLAMEQRFQERARAMERAAEKAASVGLKCWGEVAALKIELDTLRTLLAGLVCDVSSKEGSIDSDQRMTLERVVGAARAAGVFDLRDEMPSSGSLAVAAVSVETDAYETIDDERTTDVGMRQTMPSPPSDSIPVPS